MTIERVADATVAGGKFSQADGDVVFRSDALIVGFKSASHHRMLIAIEKVADDASGADMKAAVIEAIDWVFLHTDTYVLHADIDAGNAQSRVMAAAIPGSKRAHDTDGAVQFTITVARWARARGMAATIKELRRLKQHDKADRIERLGVPG